MSPAAHHQGRCLHRKNVIHWYISSEFLQQYQAQGADEAQGKELPTLTTKIEIATIYVNLRNCGQRLH